jgi:hypothetical protein
MRRPLAILFAGCRGVERDDGIAGPQAPDVTVPYTRRLLR